MFGAKKTRIEKLIKGRDTGFQKTNKTVMQELSKVVFPAMAMFVAEQRGIESGARVKFTSADIVEHQDYPQGVLMVWGTVEFEEGEQVHDDNGNLHTLTTEEAQRLSSPMQIAIPLDVAEDQHMQRILVYLHDQFEEAMSAMAKVREVYAQQLVEHVEQKENTSGDSVADYMYNVLNELDQPEEPPELEMDLSDFTEEEQTMIRQSYRKNGNTLQ